MPTDREQLSEWRSLILLIAVGAVILAGMSAIFSGDFFRKFLEAIIGIVSVTVAAMTSLFGFVWVAKLLGADWKVKQGVIGLAWIFTLFVGTPSILWTEALILYRIFGWPSFGN